jgi:histidine triad (HIT) family protein
MEECIFCKIINGEAPAQKVYEDDVVYAFWDARPTAPVHILIVPKQHVPTLNDVQNGDILLSHMGDVAKKIAKMLGVYESGYRFFINVNKGGGQVVFHLHAHIIAGKDLGSVFIGIAIIAAATWRQVLNLFKRR